MPVQTLPGTLIQLPTQEVNLMLNDQAAAYRSPAAAIVSRSGTTNTNTIMSAAAYDASTEEFLTWSFMLPANLSSTGSVTIKISWLPATAAASNVVWKVYSVDVATGASFDAALATRTVTSAGSASANVITIATITDTVANFSWAAGNVLIFHLSRDAANGSDTLTGDAHLIDVKISFPLTVTCA